MPDADSATWSGSLSPSITPSPPARLTGYRQGLLASVATVPPVATSHPPQPDWIIVMSITGTSATPNVGLAGGSGGSHTIYLRYKEVGDTNWNSSIFQADTRGSHATVPIVMTGLTPNTNYEIHVSFDNTDWSPFEKERFTTKDASATLPIVSSVEGDEITACSARIEIAFPNAGRDGLLVYFRWKQNVMGATWSAIGNYPSGGTGASSQVGLSPSTTYVAQATMDHNFVNGIVTSAPFTTTSAPYVSNVVADPIGDTTATLTATRRNFCNWFPTYHFRYRVKGTETWITRAADDYDRFITLTGLTPLTTYEVEVSFHKIFSHPFKIEFRTGTPDPPVPRLLAINLKDVVRTSVTVVAEVADAEVDQNAHLLYQNLRANTFSTLKSEPITNSEAEFPLTGLISGTRYRLWASLDDSLLTDTLTPETKPNEVLSAEFTTIPPGVIGVSPQATGQTTGRLTVTIAEPNGQDQTVYSQYRTTQPEGSWVDVTHQPETDTDTAVVNVTGLLSDTEYEARASLDSSFPDDETVVSGTFRTLPPGVTGLRVHDVKQTSAKVTVELSAANGSTLYLIYAPICGVWSSLEEPVSTGQRSVEFTLENLMSGTEYEVRISYDSRLKDAVGEKLVPSGGCGSEEGKSTKGSVERQDHPGTGGVKSDGQGSVQKDDPVDFNELTFSTLPPSVVSVAVDDQTVSQTGATVTVTVKEPNGTAQVHIRYSTDSNFPNGSTETESKVVPTTTNSNGEDTIDFVLAGLSASSSYYVEASYDNTFPATDATKSIDFTTDPPDPAVASVEVIDDDTSQTETTIRVNVANPDGTDVHIRYSTDSNFRQGSAITPGNQAINTGTSSVDFTLDNLASGTTYYVQASYDDTYPQDETKSADFTTDPPTITGIEASNEQQTTATVTVTVKEPNDSDVRIRYSTDPKFGSSSTILTDKRAVPFATGESTVEFDLTGLTSGSTYYVQASYDDTFPATDATRSIDFTTDPPTVTGVAVDAQTVSQKEATVTVTVTEPNGADVHIRYGTADDFSDASPMSRPAPPTTDGSSESTVQFALTELTSGTTYYVQASYDDTFPATDATKSIDFTTQPPSVSKLEVTEKTDTTAKVTVTIAAHNGSIQTISLRYQTTPSGHWITIQPDPTTDTATKVVELTELTSDTQYRVEATLTGDFNNGAKSTTFTTSSTGPGVSEVVMSDETQTRATATITIANPGTEARTVYLQYRESGSGSWSDPLLEGDSTTATPGTASIDLTGLTSGTRHEVQASLDSTFASGVQSATFTTNPPSASAVDVLKRHPTGADVRVTVSEPNGKTTLFLRYGTSGNWSRDFAPDVSTENVEFELFGLQPDSTYQVEASFDSNFPRDATATGTVHTPQLDAPTVDVPDPAQTTAKADITVASADHQKGVVYVRYQETPSGAWSGLQSAVVTGGSATANLSGLTSDTEYKVEASLIRSFPANATGSKTFTTDPPGVDKVELKAGTITETAATVIITISAPNGQNQTVYLEYDTTANANQNTWSNDETGATTDDKATINLSGLSSGTQYTVRASLTQDFSGETRTATFTTASNVPGVSFVDVPDATITRTSVTATITIANVNAETDVYLRYQTTPSGAWSDPPLEGSSTTTDHGTATIELTGLTSGTQYKVQASLNNNFATGVQTATFRTLSPVVSGVSVTGVSRSEATVTVGVTAPNGDPVFLQYRTGSNEWIGRYASVGNEDSSVEFTLRGLSSSTTYTAQASYDSTFDTGVEAAMFTTSASQSTPPPRPRPPGGGGNSGGGGSGGSKNQPPEFMEGTRTVRSVMENTPSGKDVGKPIPADDPENDDLTYSLVGPDAGDFDVEDDSGQLLTRSPLDFETKTHFLVTVSVRDGVDSEGEDDTRRDDEILVAILVTDEDETPNLPPALTETPRTVRMVAENTRSGVAVGDPIEATDPEGDALTYSLNQRDGKYFDIVETSGQLLTRSPLDFEIKAGYMVSVSVRDGKDTRGSADSANDDTIMVTVVVTDQEEPGTVTLSALRPRVGIPLTAVLTDPDGGVTDVGWVWERSEDRTNWTAISDATSTAYTPSTEDEGHYLRVTASYADRRGGSKTASAEPDASVTEGVDEEFTDVDDTNVHKPAIDALAAQGVFVDTECGDQLFCPDLPMTRWAMAVWILRILADEPDTVVGVSRFADIDPGRWWIRYVERLFDRKITIGCKLDPLRYCPDRPVARSQMASFLVRALDLEPAPAAGFTDTEGSVHAANIDALFAAGITIGCTTEPLRYCPDEPLTRAQMATFLYRMAPRVDRQALVAIFNATGGPNWKKSTNWLTDEPISEWHGVGTDSGGRVTSLGLVDNGLNGSIPPEIVILTSLEDLKLADNVLLGCIPEGARDIPQSDLDGYDLPYCE